MAPIWAIRWSVAGGAVALASAAAPAIRWWRNRERGGRGSSAVRAAYQQWWDVHRPVYDQALALLDRIDTVVSAVQERPADRIADLDDMIAELAVIVGKTTEWHVDAVAIRRLHQLLLALNATVSGPVRHSADRTRWHRQGSSAARAKARIDAARDEIERQWGPHAWQGLTQAA